MSIPEHKMQRFALNPLSYGEFAENYACADTEGNSGAIQLGLNPVSLGKYHAGVSLDRASGGTTPLQQ